MKVVILSFFLLAIWGVQASKVITRNYCGEKLYLWEVVSHGGASQLAVLNPGQSYEKNYPNPISFVQKGGPNAKTLAEFTFNDANMHYDWYDVSAVEGYDYPIRIVPPPGKECAYNEPSQCLHANCGPPEAYWKWNDDLATKACRKTGGTFEVLFCAQRHFVLKRGRQGKSLAEFTFNDANMRYDWYDVSRVVGYDYPIRITPPTGRECSNERSQCLNSRCGPPEAYAKHNDDTATKACRKTGGQFTVTFCAK